MKHAYLIIAHNQFKLLQFLINMIDDERNDIFIHIDKSVKSLPNLGCKKSNLSILENRIKVNWGSVSQISVELLLLETAINFSEYSYFHIISGTTLPLKSQTYLHDFFENKNSNCIVSMLESDEYEQQFKLRYSHFFLKWYTHENIFIKKLSQIIWHKLCCIQHFMNLRRNKDCIFIKTSNWLSLNQDSVKKILNIKKEIITKYKRTFCGDEFFIASELINQNVRIENYDYYIKVDFINANPRIIDSIEIRSLVESNYLFARKFSESDIKDIERVLPMLLS